MLTSFLIQLCKIEKTVEKKIDFGDFPWTQFFNEKFSGKEVYCSKPTQSKNPFGMPQLLACIAFFTSKINLTVFVSLAERFSIHVFKNPSYPFRTSAITTGFLWPKLYVFILDPVMPGTGRSQNVALHLPLSSQGSSGGLWERREQLVTTSSWHA